MNATKTKPTLNGPPAPEEIQRQMQDFFRQHFHGATTTAAPNTETTGEPMESAAEGAPKKFRFDYKPKDVKAYLDRYVIKQEEAKKVLSVALCDHYHHVQMALEGRAQPNYAKQNVILLGPTGVGKTYLIRSMAELIGVPFVKADATKFSETGYVGGDVEDLVRELVRKADGDIARAEYGIIFLDEIDKIATASEGHGRDVSGRGVQTNLLKLMEETEVPARAPNDIAGQMQAMMETTRRGGKTPPATINTRHILFVVSGAFGGLEKIIQKRTREATIGFAAVKNPGANDDSSLDAVQTKDFVDFGFEPEFIGRLPVRVVCHPLDTGDLYQILLSSEGSIIRQYEQSFAAYGIEALFEHDGLKRIAELAATEKTGARGLMTTCERIFRHLKFELPSTAVARFPVTRALVDNPEAALAELLKNQALADHAMMREVVREFGRRFSDEHGIALSFADDAAELLVDEALTRNKPVRDLCAEKFKDFQFGLKLISQNTGQREFVISREAVAAPDQVLSGWVVASYRPGATTQ